MAVSRLLITSFFLLCNTQSIAFKGFGQDVDTYIAEAAARYQISEVMLRGLVKIEHGWNNEISPTGAVGVGQFTTNTWNWVAQQAEGKRLGMPLVTSDNRGTAQDPRLNKRLNTFATAFLIRWHMEQFISRGIAVTDANLYMAHNIGLDGFHRSLLGQATASDIKNMRLNGMKPHMSVKNFIVFQKQRYHSHKQIANGYTLNISMPSPTTPLSLQAVSSIKKSSNRTHSPALYWVQPSHPKVIWVNPIQKL